MAEASAMMSAPEASPKTWRVGVLLRWGGSLALLCTYAYVAIDLVRLEDGRWGAWLAAVLVLGMGSFLVWRALWLPRVVVTADSVIVRTMWRTQHLRLEEVIGPTWWRPEVGLLLMDGRDVALPVIRGRVSRTRWIDKKPTRAAQLLSLIDARKKALTGEGLQPPELLW
ncbi:MAG: hypothetical protein PGN15_03920 [Aeromicrobium erythreum]